MVQAVMRAMGSGGLSVHYSALLTSCCAAGFLTGRRQVRVGAWGHLL